MATGPFPQTSPLLEQRIEKLNVILQQAYNDLFDLAMVHICLPKHRDHQTGCECFDCHDVHRVEKDTQYDIQSHMKDTTMLTLLGRCNGMETMLRAYIGYFLSLASPKTLLEAYRLACVTNSKEMTGDKFSNVEGLLTVPIKVPDFSPAAAIRTTEINAGKRRVCWECGDPTHMMRSCPMIHRRATMRPPNIPSWKSNYFQHNNGGNPGRQRFVFQQSFLPYCRSCKVAHKFGKHIKPNGSPTL